MKINAAVLEDNYYKWLKQDLKFLDIEDNFVSISTPFIDNEYDNINIYVEIIGEKIRVTDLGYTLFNLDISGVSINSRTKTRQSILQDIVRMFGITFENDTLSITTTLDRFATAKNRLLQAIMRINDIEYLATNNVKNAFSELVSEAFDSRNIIYTPNVEIPGSAGVSSFFDFVVPNKAKGEQLIRAVSRPNVLNQAKAFNFDVHSVSDARPASKFIYLVDDIRNTNKINKNIKTTISANTNPDLVKLMPFSMVLNPKENIISNT